MFDVRTIDINIVSFLVGSAEEAWRGELWWILTEHCNLIRHLHADLN